MKIIEEYDIIDWEKGYTYVKFRGSREHSKVLFATMHRDENFNNIEVFKLALMCRRTDTKLVMFGQRNHLPLFSTFADAMIFPVTLEEQDIYGDADNRRNITTYNAPEIPSSFKYDIINLSLFDHVDKGHPRPKVLQEAMDAISDEEILKNFKMIEVQILPDSLEKFKTLSLTKGQITCELKCYKSCRGQQNGEIAHRIAVETGLPFMANRGILQSLAKKCGQDYMAVQCLASELLNWSWVCDGGSSNIFSFFPYKVLAMRDVFIPHELMKRLHNARHGSYRFPMFSADDFFAQLSDSPELQQEVRNYIGL